MPEYLEQAEGLYTYVALDPEEARIASSQRLSLHDWDAYNSWAQFHFGYNKVAWLIVHVDTEYNDEGYDGEAHVKAFDEFGQEVPFDTTLPLFDGLPDDTSGIHDEIEQWLNDQYDDPIGALPRFEGRIDLRTRQEIVPEVLYRRIERIQSGGGMNQRTTISLNSSAGPLPNGRIVR